LEDEEENEEWDMREIGCEEDISRNQVKKTTTKSGKRKKSRKDSKKKKKKTS
jgi:hypothetical protein